MYYKSHLQWTYILVLFAYNALIHFQICIVEHRLPEASCTLKNVHNLHNFPRLWRVTLFLCVVLSFFLARCKGSMHTYNEMLLWFIRIVSLICHWTTFCDPSWVEIKCLWWNEIECIRVFSLIARCWPAERPFMLSCSHFGVFFLLASNLKQHFQFYCEVSNLSTVHNTPFPLRVSECVIFRAFIKRH